MDPQPNLSPSCIGQKTCPVKKKKKVPPFPSVTCCDRSSVTCSTGGSEARSMMSPPCHGVNHGVDTRCPTGPLNLVVSLGDLFLFLLSSSTSVYKLGHQKKRSRWDSALELASFSEVAWWPVSMQRKQSKPPPRGVTTYHNKAGEVQG